MTPFHAWLLNQRHLQAEDPLHPADRPIVFILHFQPFNSIHNTATKYFYSNIELDTDLLVLDLNIFSVYYFILVLHKN